MPNEYEGVSSADDDDAGFRAATRDAVEKYKAKEGAPDPENPVLLRVVGMSVRVRNPIHEYIVVLGTDT
jgi:hypothetical protein